MANTRATKSGIARDAQLKNEAKYDRDLEQRIRGWIGSRLNTTLEPTEIGPKPFAAALHDGVVLCDFINSLAPGSVTGIKRNNKMPFIQMENINKFLKAAESYGVAVESLFQTVDLFEEQNMAAVQTALYALGCVAKSKGIENDVGVKISDKNVRDFDEETLNQGKATISLQYGSNKGASQAGMSFGTQRKM